MKFTTQHGNIFKNVWLTSLTERFNSIPSFYKDETARSGFRTCPSGEEREFFIDNLLVQIHFVIVKMRWTGLAPWVSKSSRPGRLTSSFLAFR